MRNIFFILVLLLNFKFIGQTIDAKGMKQGYWKKKDSLTKHLIYEGAFKDGKPTGKFIYYYPHDTIRAILFFRKDGISINAKLFHLDGKLMAQGKYINKEIKDSTWNYYDEDGKLISTESYLKGKKHGNFKVYLPDGKLSEEKIYKDGLLNGAYKEYFDGVALRAKGQYANGLLDGKDVHYFPNGVEAASGFYIKGKKNGAWIYKEQNGSIKEKELFKNGKLASKKEMKEFFEKNKTNNSSSNSASTNSAQAKPSTTK